MFYLGLKELAVARCFEQPGELAFVWLSDSAVVVYCLLKGRSSKYHLLRRLRRITILCLAAGIRIEIRWVATI